MSIASVDLVDRIARVISSGTAVAADVEGAVDDTPFELALVPDRPVVWQVAIPTDGLRLDDLKARYGPANRIPPTLNFSSPRYRLSDPTQRVTLIADVEGEKVSKVTVQSDAVDLG